MKTKILSIFIVGVLLLGIFQVSSINAFLDQEQEIDFLDNNQNYLPTDIESAIQPIPQDESPEVNSFAPSPVTLNNRSSQITAKVAEDAERQIIQIDLEKQVVKPNEPLKFLIQVTEGLKPVAGESLVIEIIEGEYWGWYHYYYYDSSSFEDRVIVRKTRTTDSNGIIEEEFSHPESGRYSIIVRSESNSYYESRSFNIAEVGIFWRVSREFVEGQPHYSVAYILNTTDFKPITGAAVTLTGSTYSYDTNTMESEELFAGVSDVRGVVEIDFIPPSSLNDRYNILLNLSASFEGKASYVLRDIYRGGYYWSMDGYQEFSPYEFIITTDKPIYTPGETVQLRILLWKNDYLKATKTPVETDFILKLITPSQHTLLQKTVSTNSYGVYTSSFRLDSESELGSYSILTQKEDSLSSVNIRVDKYEKPAYRVNFELDKEYVAPGHRIKGTLTAIYYFGKPVVHGEVELKIGDLTTIEGTTDEDGEWTFSYILPTSLSDSGLYAISLNATVTDTVGRKVTASASLQITDEVYIWGYVNPWYPKADESINVHFGAYQYSSGIYSWWRWKPLADASVSIKIYGILPSESHFFITEFSGKTDSNGYGKVEFTLSHDILSITTRFIGTIELDENDGRSGASKFYFSVDFTKVSVELGSTEYQAGDTVDLSIKILDILNNKPLKGSVRVRVFDSDYEMIGEKTSEVPSSGLDLSFDLSSYAPNGLYYVHLYVRKTFTYEYGSYYYHRYSDTVTFTVGSAQELELTVDKLSYSLSDSMTVTGQVSGTTNAPVMIQFVKKGILMTLYIPKTDSSGFSFTLTDISTLAPKVWIYGFAVLTDGQILDTRLYVEIDSSLTVKITSNKEIYAPGDEATIDIQVYDKNQQPIATIMAISFVDSSVYGVEPDPESEKDHFSDQNYWPSVWTVSSWKGRQQDWWFWWWDDFYVPMGGFWRGDMMLEEAPAFTTDQSVGMKAPSETNTEISGAKAGQEVRDYLPENAYWKPLVIVEDGSISISLVLPDTIGEWTVRAVATTSEGVGVLEKYTFQTFLPFFVDLIKEPFVLQDDVFILKGVVYNYLGETVEIDVLIETNTGITLLGEASQKLKLPSDFLGSIAWACMAEDVGFVNVTIYTSTTVSNGTLFADAIRKPVEIVPNGIDMEYIYSGFVSSNPQFEYYRYQESVQQTEFLEISLGLGNAAISSWERLIGYPYGCVEQTISRVVPDALVMDYLNQTGQLTNETKDLLSDMITTGLSRLYSQQHSDGGWGWWYRDSTRVYMTTLVLYGLAAVRDVGFFVDSAVIERAIDSVLRYQKSDGSWDPDSWRNIDKTAFTAFVLRSLIRWTHIDDNLSLIKHLQIDKALDYISDAWNNQAKQSSYLAALYLDATMNTFFQNPSFESTLVDYLLENVNHSAQGSYWKYKSSDGYWWRALGGKVEITGLALQALVKDDLPTHMPTIRSALQWLLQQQSRWGWGNTADTAAAISSLITIHEEGFSSDEDVTLTIYINEEKFGEYELSTTNQSVIYLDIESEMEIGDNTFSFSKTGEGNVSYYFYSKQVLRVLPTIELDSEITTSIDEEFTVPIDLITESTTVYAANFTIKPVMGEINPISPLPVVIPILTQDMTINFRYNAPSEEGTYSIPGFEISYQLATSDLTKFSPGIISRRYGPIELIVLESTEGMLPKYSIDGVDASEIGIQGVAKLKTQVSGLELTRTYSKDAYIQSGDLIVVTLTIDNDNDTMNFIMLEDTIPVGFTVEPSTIQHSAETYEITNTGITFFFPDLVKGKTQISYGIVASNIRQSLASPAELSSMYDDWVVKSSSAILGEARVPIDPLTGDVIKDLSFPELISFKLTETIQGSSSYLKVSVITQDNWGIASVRVFIKQNNWLAFDCFIEDQKWETKAMGLTDGYALAYVEIMDYAGNVFISSETTHSLELDDLIIPMVPMILLLFLASIVGTSISLYVRRKGL
jgi:uncharacterized protein YfaS (alpha-2-macroglobulin family)